MKVRYTASAEADLELILTYLIERNPRAATSVGAAVEKTVARIASFPESAQVTDEPAIRIAPAGRFPYLIFYTVVADEVQIVRVLHGARLRPWEETE